MNNFLFDFLNKTVSVDTETTSLNFRDAEVIEFGRTPVTDLDMKYSELYAPRPGFAGITPKISAITGITPKMVAGRKSFDDDIEEHRLDLEGFDYIVAHNAFYDSKVLNRYPEHILNSKPWICTLKLAKKLFQDDPSFEEFTLGYLRYKLELDIPDEVVCHRASDDSYVCAVLFIRLVAEMEARGLLDQTAPYGYQIIEFISKPNLLKTFPFGKHKGKPFAEIPLSYYSWALENLDSLNESKDEYDENLAHTVLHHVSKMLEE